MSLPPVPEAVKFVAPFIQRSLELANIEPIVAHYCRYYAANQILDKQLHLSNKDVEQFAMKLLDSLEEYKANAPEDQLAIISDEDAAQAYVEGFANKVLAKAEADMDMHRVTKTTSSTFYAASLFLEVVLVFANADTAEIHSKIKFAKFHAARIIKDMREGRDPNIYEQQPPSVSPEPKEPEQTGFSESEESVTEELIPSPKIKSQSPPIAKTVSPPPPPVSAPVTRSPSIPSPPLSQPTFVPQQNSVPSPIPAKPSVHVPLTKESVKELMSQAELVSSAQKHAKYAVSALNYDDLETAKAELRKALALLEAKDID